MAKGLTKEALAKRLQWIYKKQEKEELTKAEERTIAYCQGPVCRCSRKV